MSDFRAIETSYKGYKFRSRTEARWAIFFDAAGIEWQYELEGYRLGELGLYLPDFWLPKAKAFAEVKGQEFTVAEINLCRRLAAKSGHPVIMLAGGPEVGAYRVEMPSGLLEERVFLPKDQERVGEAVAQARSARFEHGETPVDVAARSEPRARRSERRTGPGAERGASAELELIRAMLSDRSRIESVAEKLGPESFREPAYRAVYQVLLSGAIDATHETDATIKEIMDEGASPDDGGRTISDCVATLRARDLDRRAAELDRIIPLADGKAKDALIEEKLEIRKELQSSGRNYHKKFRRRGSGD